MPQQTALTLNTVVYSPRGTQNGVTTWVKSGDVSMGSSTSNASQSLRGPLKDGEHRARVVLRSPVNATVDSPCACAGTPLGVLDGDFTLKFPMNATPAQRQDFRKRIQSYFVSAEFIALVDNLEGVWG